LAEQLLQDCCGCQTISLALDLRHAYTFAVLSSKLHSWSDKQTAAAVNQPIKHFTMLKVLLTAMPRTTCRHQAAGNCKARGCRSLLWCCQQAPRGRFAHGCVLRSPVLCFRSVLYCVASCLLQVGTSCLALIVLEGTARKSATTSPTPPQIASIIGLSEHQTAEQAAAGAMPGHACSNF